MNTQELFNKLQAKYPNIEFSLDKHTELGLQDIYSNEELANVPEYFITFESGGIGIWDPYASECSRFKINPEEEYGIQQEDAKTIVEHNKLTMHG